MTLKERKKRETFKDFGGCWNQPGAVDLYLNDLEPLFLARYSGGKTEDIKRHINSLWDLLKDDEEDARKRRENRKAVEVNANMEVNGNGTLDTNSDVSMLDGPNGIKHTQMKTSAEQTAA